MAIKTPNPNIDISKNPDQVMSPKISIPKPKKTVQTGMAPESKKDPIKQAEQLKNKDSKKEALKEAVSLSKNGQWSLTKEEDKGAKYHLHQDGHRITDKPMAMEHIINSYGPVKHLESKNIKLHDASTPTPVKPTLNKNNDQWSVEYLEKKKPSFNPRKEQDSAAAELRDRWVNFDDGEARQKIPRMEGSARTRSMSKLAGSTDYRRNPETNEVEFLLHRGMSQGEHDTHHNHDKGHTNYRDDTINGWTPNKSVAHDFGVYGGDGEAGHVASAWVPESQLHSSMKQYGGKDPDTQKMTRDEDEWLISHKNPMQHHEIVPADKNMIDRKKPDALQQPAAPVKTKADFSPDQIKAMEDAANKK